jgi:RimJ/RimL family protein N-acetyltransferase
MPWHSLVPTLTDGVVTLRAHSEDDIPGIVEQCRDVESIRWTRVPLDYAPDNAKTFVRHVKAAGWETDTEWAFAIEALDDEGVTRFAGNIELRNEHDRRAEIAFLAHPWARGRGVMERAARLILEWGFAERDLQTVIWWANSGNWASRRLAWRVGFSFLGTVPQWLDHRGDLRDGWFGVLRLGEAMEPRYTWLTPPTIEGGTIGLRPLASTDGSRIVEACNDPVSRSWLGRLPDPYDAAEALRFLEDVKERAATGHAVTWAIASPDDDRLLGVVNVFDILDGESGEVGYWVHPEARGRGVATEATRMALRHGFIPAEDGGLGLAIIRAHAATENYASRAALTKAGMRECGHPRRNTFLGGGIRGNTIAYDLLASEFTG